jgi:hypothetical protein
MIAYYLEFHSLYAKRELSMQISQIIKSVNQLMKYYKDKPYGSINLS